MVQAGRARRRTKVPDPMAGPGAGTAVDWSRNGSGRADGNARQIGIRLVMVRAPSAPGFLRAALTGRCPSPALAG